MKTVLWLVRKELLQFAADRQGAIMTVLLPVLLAVLLGAVFAPRGRAESIEMLVIDQDGGPRVRALVEAMKREPTLGVVEVSEAEARERIEHGRAAMALTIPPGANAMLEPSGLFAGRQLDTPLLYDPSREVEANIATGILTKVEMEQLTKGFTDPKVMGEMFGDLQRTLALVPEKLLSNKASWLAFTEAGIKLADDASRGSGSVAPLGNGSSGESAGLRPPLALRRSALTAAGPATGFNVFAHNFAGMLCMFMLFMAQQMATSLCEERKRGVLDRVRLSLARPWQILLAMGLGTAAVALVSSVVVYAVAMAFFKVRVLGSWAGLVLVVLCMCIMVGGFGLLLAGLGRTEKQIGNLGSALILVMSFTGGAWWPRFAMPHWLQAVCPALPTFWATEGLAAATWRGLPLSSALLPAGLLVGYGVLFALVGMRSFKWG